MVYSPIISILAHIYEDQSQIPQARSIHLLYSIRFPPTETAETPSGGKNSSDINDKLDNSILFLRRIREFVSNHSLLYAKQQSSSDLKNGETGQNDKQIPPPLDLKIYITGPNPGIDINAANEVNKGELSLCNRRISAVADLRETIIGLGEDVDSKKGANGTVCYVCGPPAMTDEFVEVLERLLQVHGDSRKRVYYEKWW